MTPIDKFIIHLKESTTLTKNEELIIADYFKIKELKKKEILLFTGEISSHMQYIAKGCLRAYCF